MEVFELKRGDEARECRKLHNEQLPNLYCSPDINNVIKWGE
jgi:hypothetical protein